MYRSTSGNETAREREVSGRVIDGFSLAGATELVVTAVVVPRLVLGFSISTSIGWIENKRL
jgi:hypothetical protein